MVRRVGPRVSHDDVRGNRRPVREGPARAVSAGVVHASQRADSRLRVCVWRREPARARVVGWRVYKIDRRSAAKRDRVFSRARFQKLVINFTWWVNRKDAEGKNIFGGGFLGLDNIGVFDRSKPLPTGGQVPTSRRHGLDGLFLQYDAVDGAGAGPRQRLDPPPRGHGVEILRAFRAIADAINTHGGMGLWDEEDGFYYDQCHRLMAAHPAEVRSLVGLLPLIAVEVLSEGTNQEAARVLQTLPMVPAIPTGPRQAHLPLRSQRRGEECRQACSPFPTAEAHPREPSAVGNGEQTLAAFLPWRWLRNGRCACRGPVGIAGTIGSVCRTRATLDFVLG